MPTHVPVFRVAAFVALTLSFFSSQIAAAREVSLLAIDKFFYQKYLSIMAGKRQEVMTCYLG